MAVALRLLGTVRQPRRTFPFFLADATMKLNVYRSAITAGHFAQPVDRKRQTKSHILSSKYNCKCQGGTSMLISKSEYPVTEADLSNYENAHGFSFPQQYRAFMLKYNGGETPETSFRLSGVSSDIRSFYELRNGKDGLGLYEIEFHVREYLKDKMIPIAQNVFGDNIFICVAGQENGKIFFRYHDRPKRYIQVADNFQTFIQKCKSNKLGHCYTIEERIEMRKKAGNFKPPSKITLTEWQKEIDRFHQIHQEPVEL